MKTSHFYGLIKRWNTTFYLRKNQPWIFCRLRDRMSFWPQTKVSCVSQFFIEIVLSVSVLSSHLKSQDPLSLKRSFWSRKSIKVSNSLQKCKERPKRGNAIMARSSERWSQYFEATILWHPPLYSQICNHSPNADMENGRWKSWSLTVGCFLHRCVFSYHQLHDGFFCPGFRAGDTMSRQNWEARCKWNCWGKRANANKMKSKMAGCCSCHPCVTVVLYFHLSGWVWLPYLQTG